MLHSVAVHKETQVCLEFSWNSVCRTSYSKSNGSCQSCSWYRENEYFPVLSRSVPEILISRDGFGSPVPRQTAHLHTQAEYGAYLRDSSRVPRWRPFIYFNDHTPSGQSRVYRVTQLRTDGVHCRESASSGPVNLKVVPNECCLGRSPWTN